MPSNPCRHQPVRGIKFRPMYQASEDWRVGRGRYRGSRDYPSCILNEHIDGGWLFICRVCQLVYAEPTKALRDVGEWQDLMDKVEKNDVKNRG